MKLFPIVVLILVTACGIGSDLDASGEYSKVQTYASNSGSEPIHILPRGDMFGPSNRVNPGAKQVAIATLVNIPAKQETTQQEFIAGRENRELYQVTCEVSRAEKTIVEFTGSALKCVYERKGKPEEADPESGTGTTG